MVCTSFCCDHVLCLIQDEHSSRIQISKIFRVWKYIDMFEKLLTMNRNLILKLYIVIYILYFSMNRSQGSIYSTFVWRFTNPIENPSFKDFILEPFDAGYMITCIIFVILGSCGMFLNGRAVYLFCRSKTVSYAF